MLGCALAEQDRYGVTITVVVKLYSQPKVQNRLTQLTSVIVCTFSVERSRNSLEEQGAADCGRKELHCCECAQ